MNKTERFQIRMEADLKQRAVKAAAKQGVTLGELIRQLLREVTQQTEGKKNVVRRPRQAQS